MNRTIMPELKIGNLRATIPIIQGGMSVGISLSGLASAVANEGGIGIIGVAGIGMMDPDYFKRFRTADKTALVNEIKKARKNTGGVIGVNILVALTDFENLALTAVEAGADLVFMGAGLPIKAFKKIPKDKLLNVVSRIIPIVSSGRAANIIFQYWAKEYNLVPDAVVVEGPLAGGHLGFKKEQLENPEFALEKLIPDVISTIKKYEEQFGKKIPVIAAGGIFTGADIRKFLDMGCGGVQMATRFVGTFECDASPEFKESYIGCKKDDIMIIDSPVGLPGRAIKNRFLEDVCNGETQPINCKLVCLKTCEFKEAPYCIALALTNAKRGNLKEGFCFAGANAYRVDKIISVKKLIADIMEEFNATFSVDRSLLGVNIATATA